MNYLLHYQNLINRAKNRILSEYTESHHIIPRCLGGSDDAENLVKLTPEEHYVAHQLLIKIHPDSMKLINAAIMMCVESKDNSRPNNKLFGWLRRRHSESMSLIQAGENNSQFGTVWVYNLNEKTSKKIKKESLQSYLDAGWIKGRILDFSKIRSCNCVVCGKITVTENKTCSKSCFKKLMGEIQEIKNPMIGREQEFLNLYEQNKSINASLKLMGFSGNNSHWGKYARKLLAKPT
jgi:hypothetical protein